MGGSSPSVTSQSNQSIPPYLQAGQQQGINLATNLVNTGYTPYQGQAVAPLSPMQNQYFQGVENAQGAWSPSLSAAQGVMGNVAGGAYTPTVTPTQANLNPISVNSIGSGMPSYYDPAVAQELGGMSSAIQNQTNMQNAQADRQAGTQGAYGGSGSALQEAENNRNGQLAMGQYASQLLPQAFNEAGQLSQQDINNRMNAASTTNQQNLSANAQNLGFQQLGVQAGLGAGNLALQGAQGLGQSGLQAQNALYTDVGQLGAAGQAQQNQAQAMLQFPYSQYQSAMQYPFQTDQNYTSALSGIGPIATQTNTSQQQPGGGLAGTLGTIAGGALLAGAFLNRGGRVNHYEDGGSVYDQPFAQGTMPPVPRPDPNVYNQPFAQGTMPPVPRPDPSVYDQPFAQGPRVNPLFSLQERRAAHHYDDGGSVDPQMSVIERMLSGIPLPPVDTKIPLPNQPMPQNMADLQRAASIAKAHEAFQSAQAPDFGGAQPQQTPTIQPNDQRAEAGMFSDNFTPGLSRLGQMVKDNFFPELPAPLPKIEMPIPPDNTQIYQKAGPNAPVQAVAKPDPFANAQAHDFGGGQPPVEADPFANAQALDFGGGQPQVNQAAVARQAPVVTQPVVPTLPTREVASLPEPKPLASDQPNQPPYTNYEKMAMGQNLANSATPEGMTAQPTIARTQATPNQAQQEQKPDANKQADNSTGLSSKQMLLFNLAAGLMANGNPKIARVGKGLQEGLAAQTNQSSEGALQDLRGSQALQARKAAAGNTSPADIAQYVQLLRDQGVGLPASGIGAAGTGGK